MISSVYADFGVVVELNTSFKGMICMTYTYKIPIFLYIVTDIVVICFS